MKRRKHRIEITSIFLLNSKKQQTIIKRKRSFFLCFKNVCCCSFSKNFQESNLREEQEYKDENIKKNCSVLHFLKAYKHNRISIRYLKVYNCILVHLYMNMYTKYYKTHI